MTLEPIEQGMGKSPDGGRNLSLSQYLPGYLSQKFIL